MIVKSYRDAQNQQDLASMVSTVEAILINKIHNYINEIREKCKPVPLQNDIDNKVM